MATGLEDQSASGTGYAKVQNNSLQATGPQDAPDNAGFAILATEQNPADVGILRKTRALEADPDYRLRVGGDTLLFNEPFYGAALNSGVWSSNVTTMTTAVSGNALILNSGSSVAANAVARVTSYQEFPSYDSFETYYAFEYVYNQAAPIVNNTAEVGAFFATGTAAPTDGVFLRYNAAGSVEAVVCFNSAETSTLITAPDGLVRHRVVITIYADQVEFWIDDVLVASIDTPLGRGCPVSAGELPLSFRSYNAAIAPATAVRIQVYNPSVQLGGIQDAYDASTIAATFGGMALQGQTGATLGSLPNWANSAAPATATLSNTTAGYGVGILGGQFRFAAPLGAETDYILFAFQVPAGAANAMNKKLCITGCTIDTWNEVVAVATTPTVFQWGISIGSTAASLATAEGATTKAARRQPLGVQSFAVADPVGKTAQTVGSASFGKGGELVANPGEFVGIIVKAPIGTATATETFRGVVAFFGYWQLEETNHGERCSVWRSSRRSFDRLDRWRQGIDDDPVMGRCCGRQGGARLRRRWRAGHHHQGVNIDWVSGLPQRLR